MLCDCKITFIAAPPTDPVTLTFNLLTSNETGDQDLSCTIHLPSLVIVCRAVVFVLDSADTHTHTHTHTRTHARTHTHMYRADKRPAHIIAVLNAIMF